jgi:CelD/BcsL family acetyltransferase involved in cellulose biosynthesis
MNTVVNIPPCKNRTFIDAGDRSHDGYSIELIAGSAAIEMLTSDGWLQKSWDTLFDACPWATVFQNRQFVTAWYQAYRDQHLPIVVKGIENGQLTGILPVVLLHVPAGDERAAAKGGRITAAGHYDAQYQTWLSAPADGEAFIKKALRELMKKFPGHPISFRFLPPQTPIAWIEQDATWRRYSTVQPHTRPFINFKDPEHEKLYQRKHFKHKMNRLKKLGEVHFECIRDLKKFESSLNEMAILYDFRQSALFNKNHFKDDPAKKDFLLELFHLGMLHTTVLKVDGKLMAAIIAVTGMEGWVHLAGINCHAPFNSRFYSPGFMHFIMLAKQLSTEGVPFFDLTPGYDAYKEELANGHDEVTEWVISNKLTYRLKKKFKKWFHTRLIASGIRPMTVELNLKKRLYQVKHLNAVHTIQQLVKRLQRKREQQLYRVPAYTLPPNVKISLHKDNLRDLLQAEFGKKSGITRWDFLADAMRRFDDRQHCFTWMENGRLLCCAWFSYGEASEEKGKGQQADNTIILREVYCHPGAKDRLAAFYSEVIDLAVNHEGKTYFLTDDLLFCRALELAGSPVISA